MEKGPYMLLSDSKLTAYSGEMMTKLLSVDYLIIYLLNYVILLLFYKFNYSRLFGGKLNFYVNGGQFIGWKLIATSKFSTKTLN